MKADQTGTPLAADPYLERNVAIDGFAAWVKSKASSPTRMRSIVGPPGVGKTIFLRRLRQQLLAEDESMLWLDLPGDLEAERFWSENAAMWARYLQAEDAHRAAQSVQDFIITAAAQSQYGLSAVLLVDGYDEVDDNRREWVQQQVFIPFLFPDGIVDPQSRIVLARRDENALTAPRLRWEDEVRLLEGLKEEQPRQQIQALLGAPLAIGAAVAVPEHVVNAIALLDPAARGALVMALQDRLTPNPFVNLCLLERQLQHPTAPLVAADYRACLVSYVARAGLDEAFVTILISRARQFPARQFTLREYDDKLELGKLVRAGVISHVHDSPRFELEAAVLRLVEHL